MSARHLIAGAGPLVVAALVGCTSSDATRSADPTAVVAPAAEEPASDTSGAADATTTTVASESDVEPEGLEDRTAPPVTTAPTTVPAPPPAETAPADPAATLTTALATLTAGYHFVTTVTVGEQQALVAEGDRIGDASRMTVTSNDRTVEYVVTPDGTWVAEAGTWQELDQVAESTDPLGALLAPSEVTVDSAGEGATVLVATYPASALGLEGDAPVAVAIELVEQVPTVLTYVDTTSGATVRTEISPLTDTTPVTVPTI